MRQVWHVDADGLHLHDVLVLPSAIWLGGRPLLGLEQPVFLALLPLAVVCKFVRYATVGLPWDLTGSVFDA